MSSLEDRVATLEAEVIRLREQVTDTHTLAAHADRDVAEFREELRAQTDLINLTRLDMGDLRTAQTEQGEKFDVLRDEVTEFRGHVTAKFDQLHGGLEHITRLLEGLGGSAPDENDADQDNQQ